MHKYDQIFDWYLSSRNKEAGVHSVKFAFKGLSPGSKIFDMGCGTGLPLARTLEQMEMNIIGVDSSELMVESFESNFPEAEVHHLPMQDYVFPNTEIGGVLCWGCLFHLTPDEQIKFLSKVFNAVAIGGRFLFTAAKEKSEKTGEMNGVTFNYYSLGSAKYNQLAKDAGWILIHESEDKDRNYEYLFERR